MKITVEKKTFVKALTIGSSFAPKKTSIPILESVKVKVMKDKMFIISSNGESVISRHMDVIESDIEDSFVFCVKANTLLSYVKLLKGDFVTLETDELNKQLRVVHDNGETFIPLDDANVYPVMKTEGEQKELSIKSSTLKRFINEGTLFIDSDPFRPVMGCMFVYRNNTGTGYYCSDGKVLITEKDKEEKSEENVDFLLKKEIFKPLVEVLDECENIAVRISDRNVLLKGDGTSIMTRVVDQRYPNFQSVIPLNSAINVKVSRDGLMEAAKRCNLSSFGSLIVLDFKDNNLKIESQDLDFGLKSSENMSYEGDGEIRIGLNGNKLISCLGSINSSDVTLMMESPTRAVVIKEDGNDYKTIVLMPMQII